MPRNRIWLCVICLSLSALFGCSGCRDSSNEKPRAKVTLATAKNLWCTLSLVAASKGYFEKEGLDVDVQYLQGGRYCLDALISNSAEFANIVDVNVAYFGFTENKNVIVIGNIASSIDSAIVVRKSSGIEKPGDIRGKRLALSPGMTSDIFAHRFLKKYGMTQSDVEILKVQPLAMQATMASKGADAASTWEPFVNNILRTMPDDCVVFRDPEIYTPYESIAVRKDWASKHPDLVKAFLRAILAAQEFVKEHPEEAKSIVAQAVELDLTTVDAIWKNYNTTLTLDAAHMTSEVSEIGDWIRNTQEDYRGKTLPTYDRYFDSTFLDSVKAK